MLVLAVGRGVLADAHTLLALCRSLRREVARAMPAVAFREMSQRTARGRCVVAESSLHWATILRTRLAVSPEGIRCSVFYNPFLDATPVAITSQDNTSEDIRSCSSISGLTSALFP